MLFLCLSCAFPMLFYAFLVLSLCSSCAFPLLFLCFSFAVPMLFACVSYAYVTLFPYFPFVFHMRSRTSLTHTQREKALEHFYGPAVAILRASSSGSSGQGSGGGSSKGIWGANHNFPNWADYVQAMCNSYVKGYVQLCAGLLAASWPFLGF